MRAHRRTNNAVTVIDHEPLNTTSNDQNSDFDQKPVFGKRNSNQARPAVTKDFFSTPPNSSFKANRLNEDDLDVRSHEFSFANVLSTLPVKTLAAVLTIAIGLPMAFIAISERTSGDNIDPITTASVSMINGLEISDVSLTRVLHQDSSVATVFGKVSNPDGSDKPLRPLVMTLYDKDGKPVQSWQHRIGKTEIQPNQNYRFMTSAIDYSGNGRTVRVTISDK